MSNLGHIHGYGALSTANKVTPGTNLWVIQFRPEDMQPNEPKFEVWHGTIRGPGGYALVYIDDKLYGIVENGLINEYAPSIAMLVNKGETITLNWSIATGTRPEAWLYLRTPEVGRV